MNCASEKTRPRGPAARRPGADVWLRACLSFLLGASCAARGAEMLKAAGPVKHAGLCDASAAVPAGSNLFVVANDEDNILRAYRSDEPGGPLKELDCSAFLNVRGQSREADLEGAACLSNRVFWIGSHGRNKNGKERLNRCRLFATDMRVANGGVTLTPAGQPCTRLLDDLLEDSRFARFDLGAAASRAPKDRGALNIEGLAATPEGHLLIGFRNPIPAGKALLIPLLNPNEVIAGQAARFDPAIELDLGGLGIRDMVYDRGTYLIIAGSYGGGGRCEFYRWAGPGATPESLAVDQIDDYNPEALIVYPDKGVREFQILSDDGMRMVDGCPCKDLQDPRQRIFRSLWLRPAPIPMR
jgi:hypothetical protein